MSIALVLWFGRVFSSHVLNYTATGHLMSSIHPHDFQTPPPFSMFSPARGRGKTTPYIPIAKAGSFTAILSKGDRVVALTGTWFSNPFRRRGALERVCLFLERQ
jgi:hypothetical protein